MLLFGVEMIRLWSLNYSWINYPTLHMVKGADRRRAHFKKKKKKGLSLLLILSRIIYDQSVSSQ